MQLQLAVLSSAAGFAQQVEPRSRLAALLGCIRLPGRYAFKFSWRHAFSLRTGFGPAANGSGRRAPSALIMVI